MIKGVVFDMDGVLVDSEKLYLRFWIEACRQNGFELSEEQALSLRSNSAETAAPKFIKWFGDGADYSVLRNCRRELMSQYICENGVELKSGAADVLRGLKACGIKIALATASPIERASRYLSPHGIFDLFDAVTDGHSVEHSKPAPDIYIASAEALELDCIECIAVEDSPSGLISAHRAGCYTVMIPDLTEPDADTIMYIDSRLDSLSDIEPLILRLNDSSSHF